MKNVLVASFDMEIGGVERSLAGMLNEFDYDSYQVDLMLYRHQGDFMDLLSDRATLLDEMPQYASFRTTIAETIKARQYGISMARLLSKGIASWIRRKEGLEEPGYIQQQYMWLYAMPYLPHLDKEYDVAISYLWPHYFVADKVRAKKKVAWIHTDYSNVDTQVKKDLQMWSKFDAIIAVSEACKESFLQKYGQLRHKLFVIENVSSAQTIHALSNEPLPANPLQNDTRFKLLTVARLSHAKGIDHAVKALKLLHDRGLKQFVWYVVGYGGDEEQIKALIAANGLQEQFILLGKQTNPYPYMKACDLYVQPSRYEGKAVTVTEAQILHKPVMITNYSTAASQVNHLVDGYVTELSVQGIADGIETLYENEHLRLQLANNCQQGNLGTGTELEKLYAMLG